MQWYLGGNNLWISLSVCLGALTVKKRNGNEHSDENVWALAGRLVLKLQVIRLKRR